MLLSHFYMEQDLIMPVSALQHRVTAGAYQNKLHNNIRGSSTTQAQSLNSDRSAIPDEIHHAESSINRVVNSHEELSRLQTTSPRQGIAAPLLMLLSQVRLADTPVAAAGRTTVSGSEMKHPVSENVEQSDNDNNLLSTLWNPIPQTLSRAGEFMLQHDPLRFPEASALPAGGYQNKAINRFPRYAVFQPKTTTPSPVPDDVKIEKLDFSCIEERQNLSISDVFRQIGKTLSNPVSELAKESQVIHYYNNYHRCPTPEEMSNLLSITSAVDKTISIITALLPGSQPLVVTQRLGGPLFRMIADSIDNKQLNVDDLSDANDQLLALGKSIVDTSPKNSNGQTIEGQLRVPDGLFFKNKKLSVNIKGVDEGFTIKNGNYFANVNGKHRRISYSSKNKEWTKTYRYIKTSGDNISFQDRIGKLLSGSIDEKTLSSKSPNQHGIYTFTSKKSAESFHAIKIGDKLYRYIPASEKNVSLSGVIKTDHADIRVTRFDKRYFIVNEKKKFSVNYSPCRLGRSPGSSCLHLSDGLISKLKECRENGISERKIKGFKPSENNPGLYESAKGILYLKYDDVYFKLIRLEDGVADSQFMVTGKKRFGSKEVTPVCFSREQGFNYINTPQENMMESAGMSRAEAMSHIETSPKPVVIGTGSISEVHDMGNGFVNKTYKGRIDERHKSRLVAANNNAKGFNRYYGDGAGKVSITPFTDDSASVSVKLKKIDGHVLSNVKSSSNPELLKEIEAAIKTSNPSEKLSKSLQNNGVIHYDINKGNVIYNKGEFYIIDFDSANFLPKGDMVSQSQTNSMRGKFKHIFDDILREIDSNVNYTFSRGSASTNSKVLSH